jgi:hypothetical protein
MTQLLLPRLELVSHHVRNWTAESRSLSILSNHYIIGTSCPRNICTDCTSQLIRQMSGLLRSHQHQGQSSQLSFLFQSAREQSSVHQLSTSTVSSDDSVFSPRQSNLSISPSSHAVHPYHSPNNLCFPTSTKQKSTILTRTASRKSLQTTVRWSRFSPTARKYPMPRKDTALLMRE